MQGKKTPRWRGITLAHEIQHEGISFAMASDNVRDEVCLNVSSSSQSMFNWFREASNTEVTTMKLPMLRQVCKEASTLKSLLLRKFALQFYPYADLDMLEVFNQVVPKQKPMLLFHRQ